MQSRKGLFRNVLLALMLLLGIFMMAVGAKNGEMFAVFNKATKICMECIGIG